MADALYVKTADGLQKLDLGGGSGGTLSTRKTVTTSIRPAALTAGESYAVPTYTMGDGSLAVLWNGVTLAKGVDYEEKTSTTVAFTFPLAVDDVVTAVALGGEGGAGRAVQTDAGRSAVIKTGTAYTVPKHTVGAGELSVFLDGLQYTDFADLTATTISFDIDIPADMQIVVRVGD